VFVNHASFKRAHPVIGAHHRVIHGATAGGTARAERLSSRCALSEHSIIAKNRARSRRTPSKTVAMRALLGVLALMATAAKGCTSAGPTATAASALSVASPGFLPAPCEQRAGDLYRPVVPSTIETIGARHVLTVSCDGTHSIYIAASSTVDPTPLHGRVLCVRYRYVDQPRPLMPCLRPPCPERERVVDIVEARITSREAGCSTP
jgi:hypothetical protein